MHAAPVSGQTLESRISIASQIRVPAARADVVVVGFQLVICRNLYRFYWPGSDRLPLACARARADLAWLDILTLCFASFLFFELLFCGFWSSSRFCQYGFRNSAGSK